MVHPFRLESSGIVVLDIGAWDPLAWFIKELALVLGSLHSAFDMLPVCFVLDQVKNVRDMTMMLRGAFTLLISPCCNYNEKGKKAQRKRAERGSFLD